MKNLTFSHNRIITNFPIHTKLFNNLHLHSSNTQTIQPIFFKFQQLYFSLMENNIISVQSQFGSDIYITSVLVSDSCVCTQAHIFWRRNFMPCGIMWIMYTYMLHIQHLVKQEHYRHSWTVFSVVYFIFPS